MSQLPGLTTSPCTRVMITLLTLSIPLTLLQNLFNLFGHDITAKLSTKFLYICRLLFKIDGGPTQINGLISGYAIKYWIFKVKPPRINLF